MKCFPVEGGDQIVADMLTILIKIVTEQNNYSFEESLIFKDEIVAGRGTVMSQ